MKQYKSKIIDIKVVNGKNPINKLVGSPIYLGKHYPKKMVVTGRCGHVIGIGESPDVVKVYSDGFLSEAKDFINVSDEFTDLSIYNDNGLFVIDNETIGELTKSL